tara:strand:+ start:308 stop:616 length:309 start_codon:yes stop_codon:yes gene_type:complete
METILKANKASYPIVRSNLSLILFVLIVTVSYQSEISICLFKNITGTACIGCGMTSAIVSFYKLQIVDGINYNWKVIIVAPLIISIFMRRLLMISKSLLSDF